MHTMLRGKLALAPPPRMRRHLHRGQTPVLTVVVALVLAAAEAGALERLVVRKGSEYAEDDGNTCIELDAHERVRHALADVLEVHRRAFDEHADSNDRVEWFLRHRDRHGRRRARARRNTTQGVEGEPAEQVRRGRAGLDVGAGEDSKRLPDAAVSRCTDRAHAGGRTSGMRMGSRSCPAQTR